MGVDSAAASRAKRKYREANREYLNGVRRFRRALYRSEHPLVKKPSAKIDKTCAICETPFSVFPSKNHIQCCSFRCSRILAAPQFCGNNWALLPRVRLCLGCGEVLLIHRAAKCLPCYRSVAAEEACRRYRQREKTEGFYIVKRQRDNARYRQIREDPVKDAAFRRKLRESEARRRAIVKATRVARVSYERLLATYGMHCYLCDLPIPEGQLSFDHVVPLARGGAHIEDNIRPTHLDCNRRKHTRLVSELSEWH